MTADIWHLVASQVKKHDVTYSLEPSVKYAQLEFILYIERKPLYYIVNIMICRQLSSREFDALGTTASLERDLFCVDSDVKPRQRTSDIFVFVLL